jgi:hypothetical protein
MNKVELRRYCKHERGINYTGRDTRDSLLAKLAADDARRAREAA